MDKRKVKYIKQLKIIETIKISNLTIKNKIKSKEWKLKNLNTNYTNNTGASISRVVGLELLLRQVFFGHNTSRTTD